MIEGAVYCSDAMLKERNDARMGSLKLKTFLNLTINIIVQCFLNFCFKFFAKPGFWHQ